MEGEEPKRQPSDDCSGTPSASRLVALLHIPTQRDPRCPPSLFPPTLSHAARPTRLAVPTTTRALRCPARTRARGAEREGRRAGAVEEDCLFGKVVPATTTHF